MKFVIPILLLVVLGCGGETSTTTTPATPSGPPVSVKAADLTKAYDANELAADGQYKGKTLEVTGKISSISETLGSIQVDLEGHAENGISIVSVKCTFNESEKPSVAALKKGGTATLIGTGDGMTAGLYVGLNECKVKR